MSAGATWQLYSFDVLKKAIQEENPNDILRAFSEIIGNPFSSRSGNYDTFGERLEEDTIYITSRIPNLENWQSLITYVPKNEWLVKPFMLYSAFAFKDIPCNLNSCFYGTISKKTLRVKRTSGDMNICKFNNLSFSGSGYGLKVRVIFPCGYEYETDKEALEDNTELDSPDSLSKTIPLSLFLEWNPDVEINLTINLLDIESVTNPFHKAVCEQINSEIINSERFSVISKFPNVTVKWQN